MSNRIRYTRESNIKLAGAAVEKLFSQITEAGHPELVRHFCETGHVDVETGDENTTAQLLAILDKAIQIIGAEQKEDDSDFPLRILACKAFSVIVEKGKVNIVNPGHIEHVLLALQNSMSIQNIELFSECHNVMLAIVETLYENVGAYIQCIFENTKAGFAMQTNGQKYGEISINFWKEIANFEVNIKEEKSNPLNSRNEERQELLLCEAFSGELTDIFTTIIQNINPEDTEVEDPIGNPQLSMCATMALAALYKAAPQQVFSKLSALIADLKTQESWIAKHSFCVFIYVLIGKTIDAPHSFERSVYTLIQREFSKLCMYMETENQRLRETSLWVVSRVLCRFPTLLCDYDEPVSVIQQIIAFFGPEDEPLDETTHHTIILRVIHILFYICKSFRSSSYNTPLHNDENGMFPVIMTYLLNILQLPQTREFPDIIENAHVALNGLFTSSRKNIDLFIMILQNVMETINEVASYEESEDIKSYREAGLCSNINVLVNIIDDKGTELFPDIIHLLFGLLDKKKALVSEEALRTIATIITKIDEDSPVYAEIEKIMEYIKANIETNNTGVINGSCILISSLFSHFRSNMETYFNPMFQILHEIIENENIAIEAKPAIIHAIADVISCIGENNMELVEPLRSVFLAILVKYRDIEYSVDSASNNELANELLESVAYGFCAFGKLFFVKGQDFQVEKSMLVDVAKVSTAMYRIRPLEEPTLMSALYMYLEYSRNCSRRNNILINKQINHKIISIAKCFKKTSDYANTVKRILENT